mmetsp:Transcript_40259/g.60373  ORF Transcript_40259/g.60373 Transcript_40259/m.60373 type:complete len:277 (+) Transcript_40259:2707-3537(+)
MPTVLCVTVLCMSLQSKLLHDTLADNPNILWQNYRQLIHSQSQVGWDQVKYARFTKDWLDLQDSYDQAHPIPIKQKVSWLRQLMQYILNFAQTRWEACNNKIYSKDAAYAATRTELLHQLKALYAARPKLSTQDQTIFRPDLQGWENHSIAAMHYWIKVSKPLIQFCLGLTRKQKQQQASNIRTYVTISSVTRIPKVKSSKKNKKKKTKAPLEGHQDIRKFITTTQPSGSPKCKPTTSTITEYYTTQGRPQDTTLPEPQVQMQAKIQDFFSTFYPS